MFSLNHDLFKGIFFKTVKEFNQENSSAYLSIFNNDLSIDGGIDYPQEFRDSPWYRISSSEIVRHPLYIHWCAITNGTAAYDTLSCDEVRSFAKGYNFDSLQKGSFVHIRG